MGVYIDYSDIAAGFDLDTIEMSTDEEHSGVSKQTYVNNLILKREKRFEGYAIAQYPDLTALRAAQPEQAQEWITAMVTYDLFKRRGACPKEIQENYLRVLQEMKDFALTGVPQLIGASAALDQSGQQLLNNMTENDFAEFTKDDGSADLPYSEML